MIRVTGHQKSENPVLLITEGDPWGEPKGGQTTFAKHLLKAFGPKLAVTSYCEDRSGPVGQWVQRPFLKENIWFLNRGNLLDKKDKKPLIPARISAYFNARRYMPQIRQKKFEGVIIDSPEMLFAAKSYKWSSVCYRFAGVNNPVANSRYPWARIMGGFFERCHIASLNGIKPDIMIAAADRVAIEEFHNRTGHLLDRSRFYQFPTRVDTDLFFPTNIEDVRKKLGIPLGVKVLVATGRLCWIKGWDFLLEAFVHIKKDYSSAILIFVGDGEDHAKVEEHAKVLGVQENIRITGFIPQSDVARYMNEADVCLVGSHREGWSVAMCEMLACGKAVVSTDVSGAREMVTDGVNGYIVCDRNPVDFSRKVHLAMALPHAAEHSLRLSQRYAVKYLKEDLTKIWKVLNNESSSD